MTTQNLNEILRTIVFRYGIERVDRALHKLRKTNDERMRTLELMVSETGEMPRRTSLPEKRKKVTAQAYISKMDVSPETRTVLVNLANKFENKTFLPTLGEIRNFCALHGIDESSISSRVSAIPRIFGFLAALGMEDIQRILHSDSYAGPSRLAPIADAIRRSSAQRMGADSPNLQPTRSSVEQSESEAPPPSKPSTPSKM